MKVSNPIKIFVCILTVYFHFFISISFFCFLTFFIFLKVNISIIFFIVSTFPMVWVVIVLLVIFIDWNPSSNIYLVYLMLFIILSKRILKSALISFRTSFMTTSTALSLQIILNARNKNEILSLF